MTTTHINNIKCCCDNKNKTSITEITMTQMLNQQQQRYQGNVNRQRAIIKPVRRDLGVVSFNWTISLSRRFFGKHTTYMYRL